MPNLVGTGLNQVPTNSMLGGLAYQDPDHASIKDLDLKNLSQINSEIADTAIDIFVYDTRKDSDGGAWRKRTQHTSWYNETLNTSTRGSRKEFPAVAVIVAETNKVTIYDGDDPDLPMWMVFTNAGQVVLNWATSSAGCLVSAIYSSNGILSIAKSVSGCLLFNFIKDDIKLAYSSNPYSLTTGRLITDRNNSNSSGWTATGDGYIIVNALVNDVAMTVLPNAPIDDSTGLPVPTIAVATDGGVSVIKDDGNVFDGFTSITSIVGLVRFDGNKVIYAADNDTEYKWIYQFDIPSSDNTGNSYLIDPNSIITNYNHNADFSTYSAVPLHYTGSIDQLNYTNDIAISNSNEIFVGAGRQLAKVQFTGSDYNSRTSLFSSITSTYNTGWQTWNIKGAFLSDTDATNVTGSDLIDNGDFGTGDFTNWSTSGTTTPTISSGGALLTTGAAADGAIWQSTSGEATSGKWVITWTVTSNSGGFFGLFLNNNGANGSGGSLVKDSITTSGSYYYEGNITAVEFRHRYSGSGIIDNITLRRVEDDRSVNNNRLDVYGTITKTPVATGAELVGYSGWSSSNYLQQPYNGFLNVGTGDYCFMGWIYSTNFTGNQMILGSDDGSGNTRKVIAYLNSSGQLVNHINGFGSNISLTASSAFSNNVWSMFLFGRKSGVQYTYINGILNASGSANTENINFSTNSTPFAIGYCPRENMTAFNGSLSLIRTSTTFPSPEQIKKIYEDEKVLFQENAACTLHGSSDAVTALAYDDSTNLLYAGTSSGRSDFQGLRRINNTTTAVTTAISASNGLVAEQ